MEIKVVNISKTKKYAKENFLKNNELYIYCGRPKVLSNPFIIGKDGNREEVIKKHKELVNKHGSKLNNEANRLIDYIKGKKPSKVVLGCHCKPLDCHCDVYKSKLDSVFNRKLF